MHTHIHTAFIKTHANPHTHTHTLLNRAVNQEYKLRIHIPPMTGRIIECVVPPPKFEEKYPQGEGECAEAAAADAAAPEATPSAP